MPATNDELAKLEVGDVVRCTAQNGCECLVIGKEYSIRGGLSRRGGGPYIECRDVGSPHPVTAGEFVIVSTAGPW